jgi:hypothetical protein
VKYVKPTCSAISSLLLASDQKSELYFNSKIKNNFQTSCRCDISRNTASSALLYTNTPSQCETDVYHPRSCCLKVMNLVSCSGLVKMSASCLSVEIH